MQKLFVMPSGKPIRLPHQQSVRETHRLGAESQTHRGTLALPRNSCARAHVEQLCSVKGIMYSRAQADVKSIGPSSLHAQVSIDADVLNINFRHNLSLIHI